MIRVELSEQEKRLIEGLLYNELEYCEDNDEEFMIELINKLLKKLDKEVK